MNVGNMNTTLSSTSVRTASGSVCTQGNYAAPAYMNRAARVVGHHVVNSSSTVHVHNGARTPLRSSSRHVYAKKREKRKNHGKRYHELLEHQEHTQAPVSTQHLLQRMFEKRAVYKHSKLWRLLHMKKRNDTQLWFDSMEDFEDMKHEESVRVLLFSKWRCVDVDIHRVLDVMLSKM